MKNLALVTLAAMLIAPAAWAQTINAANAPSGAHFATAEPTCTTDQNLNVSCTAATIGGVGNTNITVTLTASYSGTVTCTNGGGKLVDVKTKAVTSGSAQGMPSAKNGQIAVPALSVTAPSTASLLANATCPNGNWTKSLVGNSVTLVSFAYTITFDGFSGAYFSIP
ncbi:hypothetical protein GCT13_40720 [Paraburkholderia sp. CNPSo 3157]|uniref:Spore coat protein U domain-containing protein n=1 Tax=Paraburkholderia franconis TaxID=2654983 RepID=A0A7X1NJ85_9BURK|nr:hypothetical protein [Paraburkholderia franconis]MPW22945.1 hypothetical protein [Paraburkholderia franconis]